MGDRLGFDLGFAASNLITSDNRFLASSTLRDEGSKRIRLSIPFNKAEPVIPVIIFT